MAPGGIDLMILMSTENNFILLYSTLLFYRWQKYTTRIEELLIAR